MPEATRRSLELEMFNAMSLAVGFFGGTLVGIAVMALAAAGELRPKGRRPAMVPIPVSSSRSVGRSDAAGR